MAITINGKIIRNIPEQVGKNKRDINELILSIPTYGKSIELEMDSNYVITLTLKDAEGHALSHASVDLPLEATVVDGRYDDDTKELILVLQNGNEISIPVAGLISGLASTGSENNFTALQKFAAGIELKASALSGDYRVVSTDNQTLSFIYWDNNAVASKPLTLYKNGNVDIGAVLKAYSITSTGTLYLNGGRRPIEMGGTIRPTYNDSDIGVSSGNTWRDIYLSGDLKSGTNYMTINNLYGNFAIYRNNELMQDWGYGESSIAGTLRPRGNGIYDLGFNNMRWKDIYLSGNLSNGTDTATVEDIAALITYAKAQGWIS